MSVDFFLIDIIAHIGAVVKNIHENFNLTDLFMLSIIFFNLLML